ncbi:MAG: hypothetical protein A3J82_08160 [Elusimicrobia bacterium RIFOXYA2_FULL_69_6]|nr:MAG: hypothetical protein A3J82_08160 [Elusimicrobia bacterium RIFOXYA2_FULL_69_6]
MNGRPAADAWLGLAARVVLGLVFVAAGTLKAAAPAEEFALVIETYGLVTSRDLILVMAAFLPWLEVVFGYALVFGFLTRLSAAVIGGMSVSFAFALLFTILKGIRLPDCGCFGFGMQMTQHGELAMNGLWAACAVQAFRRGSARLSLDAWCGADGPTGRT